MSIGTTSIGTLGAPQTPQPPLPIGPPSVQQKNTLAQQYALEELSRDIIDELDAWQATDTARVSRDQFNILGELPGAGLPPPQAQRVRQDAEHPGRACLGADVLYLKDYMNPDSPLTVAKTYKPADFYALNNTSSDDGNASPDNPSDTSTASALPDAGGSQGNPYGQPAPFNNLPAFSMAT